MKPGAPPLPVTVRVMATDLVRVPLVPITVTVEVPACAVEEAVKVSELELVVEAGLKLDVTPVGSPLVVRATLPEKPPVPVTVTVVLLLEPRSTDTVVGLAASAKLGEPWALTVKLMVTVWVVEPDLPVMVRETRPVAAEVDAVKVRTLVVLVEAGAKLEVTPLGRPLTERSTAPEKPPDFEMVTVVVPLSPWLSVRLGGATVTW